MKKRFVSIVTLLLLLAAALSLAVSVSAEESDTLAETVADTATAADTTADDTAADDTAESFPLEEIDPEGGKTNFGFYPETLKETLPIMGMGMLGIFLVTCVIILAVLLLGRVGRQLDKEDGE